MYPRTASGTTVILKKLIGTTRYRGILFMLISSFSFSWMGAFTKYLGHDFSSIQLVFFRNILGVTLIAISLWQRPMQQKGGKPWLLIGRGLIGTLSLYAFFFNITRIPLGEAVIFSQTSPIFVALFSWLLLRERINIYTWAAILIGFGGILCVFRPGPGMWQYGLAGLFNGMAGSLALLSVRELKKYYDTRAIVLSFMLTGIVLPIISLILGQVLPLPAFSFIATTFHAPVAGEWLPLIGLGLTALAGQVLMTRAYGIEKAGVVAGISYSNVAFSIILGLFLGDPTPDKWAFAGISLVIASGLILSLTKDLSDPV